MAGIGSTDLTYADWAKRRDPDGNTDVIVEILSEVNPILDDAVVSEGNLPTGHRSTVRSGLPTAAWRMLNYGVANSKSRTVQVTDNAGMLEVYSEVDKDLAKLNADDPDFRVSEDAAFLESMSQTMADTMFYGNTDVNPERFLGLAPRYGLLSADSGANIYDAGGTSTDNTSVWFVTWDRTKTFMMFPKGSKAGFTQTDLGEQTLTDAAGGQYQGYRTHYKWDNGMVVRDWRYNVRIANIDVSDLQDGTYATLIADMIKAYHLLHAVGMGNLVIYVNRTVATYLHILAAAGTNVNLTLNEYAGKPITHFLGVPIRVSDALLNTEARVV